MGNSTPLSGFEKAIVATVARATFAPGTRPKRFIRDICNGRIQQLSEKGRWYLAYVAHRFRRQYTLTAEQWAWVNARLNRDQGKENKIGEGAVPQLQGNLFA